MLCLQRQSQKSKKINTPIKNTRRRSRMPHDFFARYFQNKATTMHATIREKTSLFPPLRRRVTLPLLETFLEQNGSMESILPTKTSRCIIRPTKNARSQEKKRSATANYNSNNRTNKRDTLILALRSLSLSLALSLSLSLSLKNFHQLGTKKARSAHNDTKKKGCRMINNQK